MYELFCGTPRQWRIFAARLITRRPPALGRWWGSSVILALGVCSMTAALAFSMEFLCQGNRFTFFSP
jgi:hypothetical protein